jgi:hypothetical protein
MLKLTTEDMRRGAVQIRAGSITISLVGPSLFGTCFRPRALE